VIVGGVRVAAEDSEVGVFGFVCFFGLKFVVEDFYFEVIEEDDIADSEVEGEIFLAVAPEIDLKGLVLLSVVDEFEFLGVVPVGFVAVDIGAVDDEAHGGVEFIAGGFVFVVLLLELCEGEQLSVFLHLRRNIFNFV